MRTTIAAAAIAAAGLLAAPLPARALGADYCVNCATEASQLESIGKQALQYALQLQQKALQLQQYEAQLRNMVALPQMVWAQAQSDIMQVQNLSNMSALLSGNAGGIISRLNAVGSYTSQIANLGQISNQFTIWQQTIGNNANSLGRVLGLQESQQQNNAALLAALEQQSQSAVGQMQAIQAGNEIAAQNAAQLQEMEATLQATSQAIETNTIVDGERQAMGDAALQHFLSDPWLSTTGNAAY